jgi:PAT family beta-lactamase induction signal transducer AmpG
VTTTPESATQSAAQQASWTEALAVYFKPRVLVVLLLGFSGGLPFSLTGMALQAWMTESGVDIRTIGLFAAIGIPYLIKFLWAPLTDALDVPVLSALLGRRRGWLMLTQLWLIAAIALMAFCNPALSPLLVGIAALMVATAIGGGRGRAPDACARARSAARGRGCGRGIPRFLRP